MKLCVASELRRDTSRQFVLWSTLSFTENLPLEGDLILADGHAIMGDSCCFLIFSDVVSKVLMIS